MRRCVQGQVQESQGPYLERTTALESYLDYLETLLLAMSTVLNLVLADLGCESD